MSEEQSPATSIAVDDIINPASSKFDPLSALNSAVIPGENDLCSGYCLSHFEK